MMRLANLHETKKNFFLSIFNGILLVCHPTDKEDEATAEYNGQLFITRRFSQIFDAYAERSGQRAWPHQSITEPKMSLLDLAEIHPLIERWLKTWFDGQISIEVTSEYPEPLAVRSGWLNLVKWTKVNPVFKNLLEKLMSWNIDQMNTNIQSQLDVLVASHKAKTAKVWARMAAKYQWPEGRYWNIDKNGNPIMNTTGDGYYYHNYGFFVQLSPHDLITQAEAVEIGAPSVQAVNNAIRDGRLQRYTNPDAKYQRQGKTLVSKAEVLQLWPGGTSS